MPLNTQVVVPAQVKLPGSSLSADGIIWSVTTTTRSSNAFSGSLATTPASLVAGMIISWRVPSAPSGASTYNLNSLGAKDIYIRNAAAGAADLVANRDLTMRYDGTRWQIISMGTIETVDLPGGLISGKILATLDTSGTGDLTGSDYTVLKFTTSTNTISTAGSGFYTLTQAGQILYELRLALPSSRDLEIRCRLNLSVDASIRDTNAEINITGLMPVAIGEYIEFVVYNYGATVAPTSGRLRATLLTI